MSFITGQTGSRVFQRREGGVCLVGEISTQQPKLVVKLAASRELCRSKPLILHTRCSWVLASRAAALSSRWEPLGYKCLNESCCKKFISGSFTKLELKNKTSTAG